VGAAIRDGGKEDVRDGRGLRPRCLVAAARAWRLLASRRASAPGCPSRSCVFPWPDRLTRARQPHAMRPAPAAREPGGQLVSGQQQRNGFLQGEIAKLDLQKLHSVMKAPVIFDGRNLFAPEEMAAAGFLYHSVGRPSPAVTRPATTLSGIPIAAGHSVAQIAAAAGQASLAAPTRPHLLLQPRTQNAQSPGAPQRATDR